jgi:putative sterol carrier protein
MTDPLIAAASAAFRQGFGAVLKLETEGGPSVFVDGRGESCVLGLAAPAGEPSCVWRADGETLLRALQGGRALESAYLSGRLKISGDMSVMARLVLESSR